MEFGSVDEILKFALEREKDAVRFYSDLAKEATQDSLKKTFELFAKEEGKHIALISDISGNKEKIDSYQFEKIPDLKISNFMQEIDYQSGMPMSEILRLAMKREEKAVNLYTMMADQTSDEEVKKVMLILVQEEAKHKYELEKLYDDYLAESES